MKLSRILPLLLFMVASFSWSQSCTSSTCTAASPNASDVLAALPSPSNTNPTVVVTVPGGAASWTGQLTYTIPAAVTNLTIKGGTTINCTGMAGTSTYACTPSDVTVITDAIVGNFGVFQINGSSGSNPTVRVTGFTWNGGSGLTKFQGTLLFYSNNAGSKVRVDNNHFNATTYAGGSSSGAWAGRFNGCFIGSEDHNIFDNASPTDTTSVVQGFMHSNTCGSDGNGDQAWTTATGFGTANFIYSESNIFNGGLFGDCIQGGRFVSRYNTFNSNSQSSSWIHNHGTAENGGRARSCRAFEAYKNYLNPVASGSALIGDAGGTGLIWGNTVSHVSAVFIAVGDERNDGGHPQTATPNGWGDCGLTPGPISNWDENVDSTGRACLDGIGRGQGLQGITGAQGGCTPASPCPTGPSVVNSTTGIISWPEEYLEPVYAWMNSVAGTPMTSIASPATVLGRDLIVDNPSFNGTSGTGFGLLSAMPATCTAGPGGTYGTSPTGSYGVAYFATDANGGNGELYVCTATNVWTPIYQPYVYPNPLVSGGTLISFTETTAGSGTGTITGCTTNNYAPNTVLTCTATATGGSTLSSVSGTGSASSCTSSPCTFTLTTTSVFTATFTGGTPTCGDPTEIAPNFGNTYVVPPTTLPLPIGFNSPSGCPMFYTSTTNGSTPAAPNGSSTPYPGGGFSLSTTGDFKFRIIAIQSGFVSSSIRGDEWLIVPAVTPVTNLIGTTFDSLTIVP